MLHRLVSTHLQGQHQAAWIFKLNMRALLDRYLLAIFIMLQDLRVQCKTTLLPQSQVYQLVKIIYGHQLLVQVLLIKCKCIRWHQTRSIIQECVVSHKHNLIQILLLSIITMDMQLLWIQGLFITGTIILYTMVIKQALIHHANILLLTISLLQIMCILLFILNHLQLCWDIQVEILAQQIQ